MKKSPFLSCILAALIACAGFSQAGIYSYTLENDKTVFDVDKESSNWYWEDIRQMYCTFGETLEVKTLYGTLTNGGWSGQINIYNGAKLTLAEAEDGKKSGELIQWMDLNSRLRDEYYGEWPDSYHLHIYMHDNSSLDYRNEELYLGTMSFDQGSTVNITARQLSVKSIGNWHRDKFTINATINLKDQAGNIGLLNMENFCATTINLNVAQTMNLRVGKGIDYLQLYIDANGAITFSREYTDTFKTQLNGASLILPDRQTSYIEGYLGGTSTIVLGNGTTLQGLERSRGDKGTDISWLLNDIVVQRGCEAEMNKGYYGGTVTMELYSSLKFDVIPVPAGVDDKQLDGGAKVVMTGDNTLNLAGRTTNVTLDAAAGRWNTVTNGVFTGTATVGAGGSLKLDCALDGNPVMNMKSDAKLIMPERELHFGTLTINAEGKIAFALKPGAPINGNVNITYTGIDMGTAPVADIVCWTSNGNTFTLNKMHGVFTKSTVNGDTRIETNTEVSFDELDIKGNLTVNYTNERPSPYAKWDVDMGDVVTGNLSVNTPIGRVKIGTLCGTGTVNAHDIQVASFTGDRLKLLSNSSVTLTDDITASDKLEVSGLNSGKAAITIHSSLTAANEISLEGTSIKGDSDNKIYSAPSYQIKAQKDIALGGTFLGGDLTVTAEEGISLGAVGTSGAGVHRATIESTSGPIIVNSFRGRGSGSMQLTACDQIILGKEVQIGEPMPLFLGNVIVNYNGNDSVTDRSDVVVNGIVKGNLTVNAKHGRVNVASIEDTGSITAKNIYLLSFSGSTLALHANGYVTLKGNVEATDTLQCNGLDNEYAGITFESSLTATNQISLDGMNISGTTSDGFLSSERYVINARDTVTIEQSFQGGEVTIRAVGDVSLGTVGISGNSVSSANISSTTGSITMGDFTGGSLVASAKNGISIKSASIDGSRKSSITSGTEVAFKGEANLQNTKVSAPYVSLEGPLALTKQSLIEGNVIAAAKYGVTVEDSTITGTVRGAKELNLVNATLGGAVGFTSLDVKGASQINADLTLAKSTVLSFFLDAANSTTPVLTLSGELCQNPTAPVESLIISLDGNGSLETGEQYALLSHNSNEAPDFWDEGCVTVIGLEATTDDLFWQGGTLYFRCTKPVLQTATWTGAVSSTWGGTDRNWVQGDYEYSYKDGVEVEFGDERSGDGIVLLKGDLAPTNVLVDNSEGRDYWFMGNGRLVGPTALVKEGEGVLTLFNDNEHTGGTIIRGGSVVLGDTAHSLGEGAVVLEGGLLDLGGNSISNDVYLSSVDPDSSASPIDNGTLTGNLILEDGVSFTATSDKLNITGTVTLGDGACLILSAKLSANIILNGERASIAGRIDGNITGTHTTNLTVVSSLSCTGIVTLAEGATLDINNKRINGTLTLAGSNLTLVSGTIESLALAPYSSATIDMHNRAKITNGITLMEGSALNLNLYTTTSRCNVTLEGSASIGFGTIEGSLNVGDSMMLTLFGNISGRGDATLGDNAILNLNDCSLTRKEITLAGSASIIGDGTLNATVSVGEGKTLQLFGSVEGTGVISLGENAVLDLGGYTTSKAVALEGSATISGGTINDGVSVAAGKTLTLAGNLSGTEAVTLGDNAVLALGGHTLSKAVALEGSATIDGGTINGGVSVGAGKTLTLGGNLSGTEAVTLGDNAVLALGDHTLSKAVALEGSARIGGGAINGDVSVGAGKTLALQDVTIGDLATFTMANEAELDLGGAEAWLGSFSATGQYATVDNGTLRVAEGMAALLGGNLGGTATVSLGEAAALDLNGHTLDNTVNMVGSSASIGGGTLGKALTVGGGKTLVLGSDLEADGGISLAANAALDLGGYALGGNITVAAELITTKPTIIGGGSVDGDITLAGSNQEYCSARLTLSDSLNGTGTIKLGNQSELNLNGHAVGMDVATAGNNTKISGDGTINGNLTLSNTVDMKGSINGEGTVILNNSVSLSAGVVYNDILVTRDTATAVANIFSGFFMGKVTVAEGARLDLRSGNISSALVTLEKDSSLRLYGHSLIGSVALGQGAELQTDSSSYAVKALAPREGESPAPGTLEQVSLSPAQLVGMDRTASLADNLEIKSEADLLIESMTITANNEIYVGENTITLKDVTIKMSDDIAKLEDGIFYFDLKSLINCELVMENVMLDAGELTLPQDFDPAKVDAVVFDFGDDVSIKQATGLDMRLGNYWATSMNLDQPGKVVFKNLVETPEPATGTISLLALCALATRRRRK